MKVKPSIFFTTILFLLVFASVVFAQEKRTYINDLEPNTSGKVKINWTSDYEGKKYYQVYIPFGRDRTMYQSYAVDASGFRIAINDDMITYEVKECGETEDIYIAEVDENENLLKTKVYRWTFDCESKQLADNK